MSAGPQGWDSWRVQSKQERSLLERLLAEERAKAIVAEFSKHGITTPSFEDGAVFIDKEKGLRYASLPFRSAATGAVHASLDAIDGHVQGVYVDPDPDTWESFVVVTQHKGHVKAVKVPWTALRDPGPKSVLTRLAKEQDFVPVKGAQRDVTYKGLFLMGAVQVAVKNALIGYYMMIAVCAV